MLVLVFASCGFRRLLSFLFLICIVGRYSASSSSLAREKGDDCKTHFAEYVRLNVAQWTLWSLALLLLFAVAITGPSLPLCKTGCHPRVRDEEAEAQRGSATPSVSHSWPAAELEPEPIVQCS